MSGHLWDGGGAVSSAMMRCLVAVAVIGLVMLACWQAWQGQNISVEFRLHACFLQFRKSVFCRHHFWHHLQGRQCDASIFVCQLLAK